MIQYSSYTETKNKNEMNKNNQLEFNKKSIILLPGRAKLADKFKIRDCNFEDSNIKKIRRKKLVKKKLVFFCL